MTVNLRQAAAAIILDHARDVEFLSISEHLQELGLPEAEHDTACESIDELIRTATVTVDWPEAATAEGDATEATR